MSGFGRGLAGTELLTADANVKGAKPTRVFTMHIISGATPGIVSLRNGTTVAGTIFITETGTASTGRTIDLVSMGFCFRQGYFMMRTPTSPQRLLFWPRRTDA